MAAGILELDKGVVFGTTWHGIPSYIQQDTPVTIEQALGVLTYPLAKAKNYARLADDSLIPTGDYSIVRTDHGKVLAPAVGARFHLVQNEVLADTICRRIMEEFDGVQIESVGTLFNGQTAFVNLKLDEYQVSGDSSPTLSRLMWYNPIGDGAYRACAHTIRVVCNNTLQAADRDGRSNGTMGRFVHCANAESRIADYLEAVAETKLKLQRTRALFEELASRTIRTGEYVKVVVGNLLPFPEGDDVSDITKRHIEEERNEIVATFENGAMFNRYGLLQAVMSHVDNMEPKTSKTDTMQIRWDSLLGKRANLKEDALKILLEMPLTRAA